MKNPLTRVSSEDELYVYLGKTILTYPTILTKILKERYPRSAMKARIPNTINNNKVKNPKWEKSPMYRCNCQLLNKMMENEGLEVSQTWRIRAC